MDSGTTDDGATTGDDGNTTTAVGVLVIVLAVIAVALRYYTRYSTKAGLKWDDWLIMIALLATIATDILVLIGLSAVLVTTHKAPTCTLNSASN
jgi:uncharacterized membrane protein